MTEPMTDFLTLICATCRKPFRMSVSQYESYVKRGNPPKYCKRSCQPEKRKKSTPTGA